MIEVLAPRGSVAFFWRRAIHTSVNLRNAIDQAHADLGIVLPLRGRGFDVAEQVKADIEASGAFGPIDVSRLSEPIAYDTAGYLRHLSVSPAYVAMPEDSRARLFSTIGRVVDAAGGRVALDVATLLYLARRKRRAPSWARRLPLPIRELGNRLHRR